MRALIVFDFDRVIYNPSPFLADTYREVLSRTAPSIPLEAIHNLNHGIRPLSAVLRKLLPAAEATELDSLYFATVRALCARVMRGEGSMPPGIRETFVGLQLRGYRLAAVSDSARTFVDIVLSTNDLHRYVAKILTIDSRIGIGKWDLLRQYLVNHSIPQGSVIMVGGPTIEADTAESRLRCHLIRYASHDSATTRSARVVSSMVELADAIAQAQPRP